MRDPVERYFSPSVIRQVISDGQKCPFSCYMPVLSYTRGIMNDCNCKPKCCEPCKRCPDPCGCPMRVLSIQPITEKPGTVRFNLDGGSVLFDFSDIVALTETDTFLRVDSVARQLKYLAEGHTNNIDAKSLGGILRLSDIGDVNTHGVAQNSLLTYQRNSECGTGCDEVSNEWVAFNASENLSDSAKTLFGFDDTDAPLALQPPVHTDQFYSLMWRGADKIGYTQPVEVAVPSVDSNGYSQLLFANPTTKQLEVLKVKVTIDNQGNVTFKTQGGA